MSREMGYNNSINTTKEDNNMENNNWRKLIDWLWNYMDETEASFKAAGYHKIDTPEKAVNAVRELVDDEEFEEILNDLALTELKELAI